MIDTQTGAQPYGYGLMRAPKRCAIQGLAHIPGSLAFARCTCGWYVTKTYVDKVIAQHGTTQKMFEAHLAGSIVGPALDLNLWVTPIMDEKPARKFWQRPTCKCFWQTPVTSLPAFSPRRNIVVG